MTRRSVADLTSVPPAALAPQTKKDYREYPEVVAFFAWWLVFIPRRIVTISLRMVKKTFNFFSIDLLFKTLLQPWKRDEIDTTNMALDDKARVWMMNLVSRLVGATVRGGTIVIGLSAIGAIIVAAILALVGIITLPVIIVWLIIQGVNFTNFA